MNEPATRTQQPALEIGLIIAGRLKHRQRRLIRQSVDVLMGTLNSLLPGFNWQLEKIVRGDLSQSHRQESARLLRAAAEERDARGWDFVILITADELLAHYRAFALAALSRPLDAAILSTARLIPEADGPGVEDEALDEAVIVDRLVTLMLHAIAHLAGLPSTTNANRILNRPSSPAELDLMNDWTHEELRELSDTLGDVADIRLEDDQGRHRAQPWTFRLKAMRINQEEIREAVVAARPWEFPQRLSRLSTAAVSTVAILLMTAEAWDLGLSQSGWSLFAMTTLVLLLTTVFVVMKQKMLLTRHARLSEQIVVTQTSAVLIVACGLAVTWGCMFVLALLASGFLFPTSLVSGWAANATLDSNAIGIGVYVQMAWFTASIGLLIGSLGASFEDQYHFQHVIFVDEEL